MQLLQQLLLGSYSSSQLEHVFGAGSHTQLQSLAKLRQAIDHQIELATNDEDAATI